MIQGIIKHFRIFIADARDNSLFVAFANTLWFIRKFIPAGLLSIIFNRKHALVEQTIQKIIGETNKLSLPKVCQKLHFKEYPIWFCWLQGKEYMPPITQLCLSSIKENSNGHPIVFLTADNYNNYIELPIHIVSLFLDGKIGYAHFADIIRTSLLYHYGGCWIDSTILLTEELKSEVFDSEFYSIKLREDPFFISKCRWSNFFLACRPGNQIMGYILEMFNQYLLKKDCFTDYFMMDYFMDMVIQSDKRLALSIDNIPFNNENTHDLKFHLKDEYSTIHFKKICGETYIHKLSWRMQPENPSESSIYNYMKKRYK
jgi:hypothetical protein